MGIGMVMGLTILAVFLLCLRDAWQHRLQEERRPVAERIARIRDSACFMIGQLQGDLERRAGDRPETFAYIPPILEYYRRLEALASVAQPSQEEIVQLSQEVSQFIQEHRIKGIFIAEEARKLAELTSRPD